MDIKFSKQAETMISKMANPPLVKSQLLELASKRSLIISGGDVLKYIICGDILTKIDPEDKEVKL